MDIGLGLDITGLATTAFFTWSMLFGFVLAVGYVY